MSRATPVMAALMLAAPLLAQVPVTSAPVAPAPSAPVPSAPAAAAKPPVPAMVAPRAPGRPAPLPGAGVTPNAQRGVVIGAINKRTGETRFFAGKPGQSFDFGALHVTVRTCETTPPWEQRLTGAFLLIDERLLRGGARRVYSGWMFAESPSLHPLEHPRYDIWVKSCTMRFPDTGPDTVVAGRGEASGSASEKRSIAKKSPETSKAEAN